MRLPGITYTRNILSLGRESIYLPMRRARARERAADSLIGNPGKAILNVRDEYLKRQTDAEWEKNTLEMSELDTTTRSEFKDNSWYPVEDIPDEIPVRRTELTFDDKWNEVEVNRTKVQGYEVKAALYKHRMTGRVKQLAKNFTIKRAGDKWASRQLQLIENTHQKLQLDMVNEQHRIIQVEKHNAVSRALDNRQYGIARNIVASMDISDSQITGYIKTIDTAKEVDQYEMAHARNDLAAMQAGLAFLTLPDEEYKEKGGVLSPKTRDTHATSLRRSIAAIQNSQKTDLTGQRSVVRVMMNDLKSMMSNGVRVPPETIQSTLADADKVGKLEGQKFEILALATAQERFAGMASAKPAEILPFLREQRDMAARDGSIEGRAGLYAMHQLVKLAENQAKLIQNDSHTYGEQWGIIPAIGVTPQNLNMTGEQRANNTEKMRAQYGFVSGYLKEEEKPAFIQQINSGDMPTQMMMAKQINEGFGTRRALSVFEELGEAGAAPHFMAAGELLANGMEMAAYFVFKGAELAKSDKEFWSDTKDEIDLAIDEKIGNAYASRDRKKAKISAIKNTYQALVTMEGEDKTAFHKDMLDKAYEIAIAGEIHEHAGYQVELPKNWTGDSFDTWWSDTPNGYIEEHYKPKGYSPTRLMHYLRSGRIRMIAVGDNKYYLYDPELFPPQFVFDNNTKDVLEFSMDPEARFTVPDARVPESDDPLAQQVKPLDVRRRTRSPITSAFNEVRGYIKEGRIPNIRMPEDKLPPNF